MVVSLVFPATALSPIFLSWPWCSDSSVSEEAEITADCVASLPSEDICKSLTCLLKPRKAYPGSQHSCRHHDAPSLDVRQLSPNKHFSPFLDDKGKRVE